MGSLEQTVVFGSEHDFYSWLEDAEGVTAISWLDRSGLIVWANGWHQVIYVRQV